MKGFIRLVAGEEWKEKLLLIFLFARPEESPKTLLDCIIIRLELRMDYLLILPFRFAFILQSLDATVSRLLAETRKLLEDLEDVKCLDDIIDMLNSEIPIIHREWIHPITNSNKIPVEQGIMVS